MNDHPDPLPHFTVVLRALPADVPAHQRLKKALKYLLRACGLRCTSACEGDEMSRLRTRIEELAARLAALSKVDSQP